MRPISPIFKRPLQGVSLVELVVVIAVISILLGVGFASFQNSSVQTRKSAVDQTIAAIEQARTRAITSRHAVALLVIAPSEFPGGDGATRIGLFQLEGHRPGSTSGEGIRLQRFTDLPVGVIPIKGSSEPLRNLLNEPPLTIRFDGKSITAPGLVVSAHGSLITPSGSDPLMLRLADGGYRAGEARANFRSAGAAPAESTIRIGRVIARPFRLD